MTNEQISKQAVSSAGGAVAGAVLFGPLGAIIGGRAKGVKIIGKVWNAGSQTSLSVYFYYAQSEV